MGGFEFFRNHRRGDQDFLVKTEGSPYRGGQVSIEKEVSTAFH